MNSSKSIAIILETAREKMSESEANTYVGTTLTFVLNQISNEGHFSVKKFETLLEEEAHFHKNCQDDVA